jgi:hypothetical protein
MSHAPEAIDVPTLPLKACAVQEHCRALIALKRLPYWWYQGASRLLGNYSLPLCDASGNWWFRVKPGFCWPADCFRPIEAAQACPPWRKTWVGYQHVVPDGAAPNSRLTINAILDLSQYGAGSIDAKRRNAIRKGFRACTLEVLASLDAATLAGCRGAWNDLSARTGWKHAADEATFQQTWRLVVGVPGASIVVGRDAASGEVAGFLITKIIGDTAYVDTIASRTDLLRTNVNDALMYAFLINAARLPGVTKAHYAIKSNVEALERFKTGLGFEAHPFPARLVLRPGVASFLRLVDPDKYYRLLGRYPCPG